MGAAMKQLLRLFVSISLFFILSHVTFSSFAYLINKKVLTLQHYKRLWQKKN